MIKINKLISLFGVLLIAYSTNAQRSIFTNFSLDEGLVQSSVLSVFQDSNANIWFGTQGGLSKYNGRTFKTYDTRHGLADNHISSILQDSKKRFWFGHRYKGVTLMYDNKISALSLTDTRITVIKEDPQGNVWFGTEGKGIYILPFDKNAIVENFIHLQSDTVDYPPNVNDIIFLKKNTTLVGTGNGLFLIEFDNNCNITGTNHINRRNSNIPYEEIVSITLDKQGDVWFLGKSGISKVGVNNFPEMKGMEVYNFEYEIFEEILK